MKSTREIVRLPRHNAKKLLRRLVNKELVELIQHASLKIFLVQPAPTAVPIPGKIAVPIAAPAAVPPNEPIDISI